MNADNKNKIEELVNWVKEMSRKGYYKKTTVNNMVNAIQSISDILEDDEKSDLATLLSNLDDIVKRWATKKNIAPGSIGPTKSHIKSSIMDFQQYQKDPQGFKTRGRGVTKKEKSLKKNEKERGLSTVKEIGFPSRVPDIHIDIQIHIAPDAPESQIDKIFESIARHFNRLFRNKNNEDL